MVFLIGSTQSSRFLVLISSRNHRSGIPTANKPIGMLANTNCWSKPFRLNQQNTCREIHRDTLATVVELRPRNGNLPSWGGRGLLRQEIHSSRKLTRHALDVHRVPRFTGLLPRLESCWREKIHHWNCLKVGRGAPEIQLVCAITYTGVGFRVTRLSSCHPCSCSNPTHLKFCHTARGWNIFFFILG